MKIVLGVMPVLPLPTTSVFVTRAEAGGRDLERSEIHRTAARVAPVAVAIAAGRASAPCLARSERMVRAARIVDPGFGVAAR